MVPLRCQLDTLTTFWWHKLLGETTTLVLYFSQKEFLASKTLGVFLSASHDKALPQKIQKNQVTENYAYYSSWKIWAFIRIALHKVLLLLLGSYFDEHPPLPCGASKHLNSRVPGGSCRVIEPFNPAPKLAGPTIRLLPLSWQNFNLATASVFLPRFQNRCCCKITN